jgi:hypothetical protein
MVRLSPLVTDTDECRNGEGPREVHVWRVGELVDRDESDEAAETALGGESEGCG